MNVVSRKSRIIYLTVITVLLSSCSKENSGPAIENTSTQDVMLNEITSSLLRSTITHYCFEHSTTLSEKYIASLEYRFVQGTQQGDQYLYNVQSRFNEEFISQTGVEQPWSQLGAWSETQLFYRYSFSDKKAYLYQNLSDTLPKVLFDFNVSLGDTVDLGAHILNFTFPVVITADNSTNINGHNFPIFEASPINILNTFIQLSPDLPNPFAFDNTGPFHELDTLVSIPPCTQTGGVTYSRGGFSFEGNWVYFL